MRIIRTMRRQTCVYWPWSGTTDDFGQRVYDAPVEIKCRWEDTVEMYLDRDGNEQRSRAKVYVDRELIELGVLWLPPDSVMIAEGEALAQLTDADAPFANDKAYEIRKVDELPVLRVRRNQNDDILRTVWL